MIQKRRKSLRPPGGSSLVYQHGRPLTNATGGFRSINVALTLVGEPSPQANPLGSRSLRLRSHAPHRIVPVNALKPPLLSLVPLKVGWLEPERWCLDAIAKRNEVAADDRHVVPVGEIETRCNILSLWKDSREPIDAAMKTAKSRHP
jgi:hypothetical protein